MTNKKLALIDGNSLLYRAFFALPGLTSPQGVPTNAVHGFLMMLAKLYEELRPDYLAVAFDKGRTTFRNKLFAEYKGHRPDAPEDLIPQFRLIREVLQTLGIAQYELEGYEGDDIIGTLAKRFAGDCETYIVTGDRDALQLIDEHTTVCLTKKGITQMSMLTPTAMREEYGYGPESVVEMKALMGDASDHIPGVPGVGEKTAYKLVSAYGDLEHLYEAIDEQKGKLRERLEENRESAYLSRDLARIHTEVPVEAELQEMVSQASLREVEELFAQLGLRSILAKLTQAGLLPEEDSLFAEESTPAATVAYRQGEDFAAIKSWQKMALAAAYQDRVPMLTLQDLAVTNGEETYYWEGEEAADVLEKLLATEAVIITDLAKEMYEATGIFSSLAEVRDVTVAAYVLDPIRTSYPLSYLAERYLNEGYSEMSNSRDELAQRAQLLWRLMPALEAELEANGAAELYNDIEMPLAQVLAGMEQTGIAVDTERLAVIRENLHQRAAEIATDIYRDAGEEFNISSPKQLGQILFEKLGLPPARKTKTGYSTDAEVLQGLLSEHPIVGKVMEYRTVTKLISTYLDGMEEMISPATGRIHSRFNQTVTATGRLSSSDPNLQNIPIRTEEGRKIRSIFVPGEGYDGFLSADYSQIELRVLAHISGDESLREAFRNNEDIHRRTAAEVLHIAPEDVTPAQRSHAKAVNFGIIYGISDFGLAKDLGITRQEAAEYIEKYLQRYPKVHEYMMNMIAQAKEKGRVETLFGRYRVLPEIHSRNFNRRSFAERTAMNTPIQGTAADIMKIAMHRVHWGLQRQGYRSRLLLQVHDELVVEVVEQERQEIADMLRQYMEKAADLAVPLVVDIHYGKNWEEAK